MMLPLSLAGPDEDAPGQLLADLERRQDDVLAQLDDLEAKLAEVLRGLNVDVAQDELD